jgi:lipopolysaccharide export LptBFGC system permease protein LptF
MGCFNRHVLKELLLAFGFSFVVVTALAIAGVLIQVYRDIPSQGLGFLLAQAPLLMGYVCSHTLAIAAAISGTVVMGRMAGARELEALRTSGVPQSRILVPALALALLVSGLAALFNLVLTPAAYRQKRRIELEAAMDLLRRPPPGEQLLKVGRSYQLRYRSARGPTLVKPVILQMDPEKGTPKFYYIGERARIDLSHPDAAVIVLEQVVCGTVTDVGGDPEQQVEEGQWDVLPLSVPREPPTQEIRDVDEMTLPQLRAHAERSEGRGRRVAQTKMHDRLAGSMAPFALVFLAAGIGMGVRRASLLAGFGATLPSLILLYGCRYLFVNLSTTGVLPAAVGPYLGVGVLVLVAAAAIGRACRG